MPFITYSPKPLGQTLWKIHEVLAGMREENLSARFESVASTIQKAVVYSSTRLASRSNNVGLKRLWIQLAELITWAHIPPGLYSDGGESEEREADLMQLEFLLAELLVGIETRRR